MSGMQGTNNDPKLEKFLNETNRINHLIETNIEKADRHAKNASNETRVIAGLSIIASFIIAIATVLFSEGSSQRNQETLVRLAIEHKQELSDSLAQLTELSYCLDLNISEVGNILYTTSALVDGINLEVSDANSKIAKFNKLVDNLNQNVKYNIDAAEYKITSSIENSRAEMNQFLLDELSGIAASVQGNYNEIEKKSDLLDGMIKNIQGAVTHPENEPGDLSLYAIALSNKQIIENDINGKTSEIKEDVERLANAWHEQISPLPGKTDLGQETLTGLEKKTFIEWIKETHRTVFENQALLLGETLSATNRYPNGRANKSLEAIKALDDSIKADVASMARSSDLLSQQAAKVDVVFEDLLARDICVSIQQQDLGRREEAFITQVDQTFSKLIAISHDVARVGHNIEKQYPIIFRDNQRRIFIEYLANNIEKDLYLKNLEDMHKAVLSTQHIGPSAFYADILEAYRLKGVVDANLTITMLRHWDQQKINRYHHEIASIKRKMEGKIPKGKWYISWGDKVEEVGGKSFQSILKSLENRRDTISDRVRFNIEVGANNGSYTAARK